MVRPPRQVADHGDGLRDGLSLLLTGDFPSGRLRVGGELDLFTAPRLARLLGDLLDAGHRQIDLDLSRLTLLAAAGLTVLCEARTRFAVAGGRLQVVEATPRIRRVMAITGLDLVLVASASSVEAPCSSGAGTARP